MAYIHVGLRLLLILLFHVTHAYTVEDDAIASMDEDTVSDDDTMQLVQPTSFQSFLDKFGQKIGRNQESQNDYSEKADDLLSNIGPPYPKQAADEITQFQVLCRNFEKSALMRKEIRQEIGFTSNAADRMNEACLKYLRRPTKEALAGLEDLKEDMAKDVLCLTRGVTYGLKSECPGQPKEGSRKLYEEKEVSETALNDGLPTAQEIQEFNRNLASYCNERDRYEDLFSALSQKRGDVFARSVLDYMSCLCDNRTDCGHLAHAAVKSFNDNFVTPLAKEMNEQVEKGQEMESELAKHKLVEDEDLIVPENVSFQLAVKKFEHSKKALPVQNRSTPLDFSIPGCKIKIKKGSYRQVINCKVFSVLHIRVTMDWRNLYHKVDMGVSLCLPVVRDIINVLKKFSLLKGLFSVLRISNGCLSVARASMNFVKGTFEARVGPKLNLAALRGSLTADMLYRFDTRKPLSDLSMRNKLNRYCRRKYLYVKASFRAEYYEVWSLFWGNWKCVLCVTFFDKTYMF